MNLRYLPFALYILVSSTAFSASPQNDVEPETIERLLTVAEKLTGRARGSVPVRVSLTPSAELCRRLQEQAPCSVWGAYFSPGEIVLSADKVNLAHPVGRATLIHEIVHYLQDAEGKGEEMDCFLSEKEAYAAERRWLESFGFKSTFGFNPPDDFTLRTECTGAGY